MKDTNKTIPELMAETKELSDKIIKTNEPSQADIDYAIDCQIKEAKIKRAFEPSHDENEINGYNY